MVDFMSYRVDRRGRPVDVRRTMNTNVSAELLVGPGWEAVAHTELRRLSLVISSYHQQLEGYAGYGETGEAVDALKRAVIAIEKAFPDQNDQFDLG